MNGPEARCPQGDLALMPPGQVVCSALCLSSPWTLDLVQPVLSLQGGLSGTSGVRLWDEKTENHGRQDRTEENLGAYILPAEEREDMASGLIRGGGPCWRRERAGFTWERHVGLDLGRMRLS